MQECVPHERLMDLAVVYRAVVNIDRRYVTQYRGNHPQYDTTDHDGAPEIDRNFLLDAYKSPCLLSARHIGFTVITPLLHKYPPIPNFFT